MNVGDRVGAILGSEAGVVSFLGFGVYAGREVPTATGSNSMTSDLAELKFSNPKILLDNGDVVWGCECWWGPEDKIRAEIAKYDRVETVRIGDFRDVAPAEDENE